MRKILLHLIRRLWDTNPSKRIAAAATSAVLEECAKLQQAQQPIPERHPNPNANAGASVSPASHPSVGSKILSSVDDADGEEYVSI